MTEISLPDTGLRAFEPLINGTLWDSWAQRGMVFPIAQVRNAVGYVRMKPSVSCLMTIFSGEPGSGNDPPPGFLLYLFPDAERAQMKFEKEMTRPAVIGSRGYQIALSEDPPALLLPFPNDPGIKGLRRVYLAKRFCQRLAKSLVDWPADEWRMDERGLVSTLLAYKPERRVVYRVRAQMRRRNGSGEAGVQLHVKLANPEATASSRARLCSIYDAVRESDSFGVPRPQKAVKKGYMFASEWIDGKPLQEFPDIGTACHQAGNALAELHSLPITLPQLPSPQIEAEGLQSLAKDLMFLLPQQSVRIEELIQRLTAAWVGVESGPLVACHGDFNFEQMLWSPEGKPFLLDFDRAGQGTAFRDLGSWLARQHEFGGDACTEQAFLRGYQEVRDVDVEDWRVRLATAIALFRRCSVPFRKLQPDWPAGITERLNRVDQILGESA